MPRELNDPRELKTVGKVGSTMQARNFKMFENSFEYKVFYIKRKGQKDTVTSVRYFTRRDREKEELENGQNSRKEK